MNIKSIEHVVVPISEVDKLKEVIKVLEKENVDLQSNIGKLTLDKENLKLNLNQKRERALKAVNEVQAEQYKRRKVGELLKGAYDSLFSKNKKLAKTQYKLARWRSIAKTNSESFKTS